MLIKRARFGVRLVVVGLLLFSLLLAWKPIREELELSALMVANRQIIERANEYKQQWILQGKPQQWVWQEQHITFSESGWVLPDQTEEGRCPQLIEWLYPERKVLNRQLDVVEKKMAGGYDCQLSYNQQKTIKIILQENRFSSVVSISR